MGNEIAKLDFSDENMLQLIKDTICKGSTDDEFKLFAYTCKRMGLDPLQRQIFPVKRWDSNLRREVMSIQTGIDGYRLIADRTGRYSPGKAPEYNYNVKGALICAKAFVMKQTPDGTWHEVVASAHYSEYVALKKDGTPNHFWKNKPHIMLAKCCEALALRKSFPSELSGVYTAEEMEQANNPVIATNEEKKLTVTIKEALPTQMAAFLSDYKDTYNNTDIMVYLEERAKHYGHSVLATVHDLLEQKDGVFETSMNTWLERKKVKGDESS